MQNEIEVSINILSLSEWVQILPCFYRNYIYQLPQFNLSRIIGLVAVILML